MSIRNLQSLFQPKSVAIIGATVRAHSVGAAVLKNMLDGGYKGQIYPVNPKYSTLLERDCWAQIHQLPSAPELAIICTPAPTIPALVKELGERGTKAAIVLTADFGGKDNRSGAKLRQSMLDAARPHLLRILGPNGVGLLVPELGLNASCAHVDALPGRIAFVSQSGALGTGVLDWAKTRGIGFSKFISLGEGNDIDCGDVLDYLASDSQTHSILLYLEEVTAARKFMSAARAAARNKPLVVLKAGRSVFGAQAAFAHSGSLAGADDIYDCAFRRAGMLRVFSTGALFDAVETLGRARPLVGDRLAIVTNSGGLGVIASDALAEVSGNLAQLSSSTQAKLHAILPAIWSHGNPVDISGDAPVERYLQTIQILMSAPEVDAVVLLHAPTAMVSSTEIATKVVELAQGYERNFLVCLLGGAGVSAARAIFDKARIPSYQTPEKAVHGFMQIVQNRRNQALLMEVPALIEGNFVPDRSCAERALAQAAGKAFLSEIEAKQVLSCYGIAVATTRSAANIAEALQMAEEIAYPVALKILSRQIAQKAEVGGVALDIETPQALQEVAASMLRRVQRLRPDATIDGFMVQTMARRPNAFELSIKVVTDPVFGPVLMFAQGGDTAAELAEYAIALPPLNQVLARDLIERSSIARLLGGFRNQPAANIDAICACLIQIGQLIADLPQIHQIDINPLLADAEGVIALDTHIRLAPLPSSRQLERMYATDQASARVARLAIRPYPQELEERIEWRGETLLLRPIKPEDGAQHLAFFRALDGEDLRFRTFSRMSDLPMSQLARLTQIDYEREMAFIACRQLADGSSETLGVVRAVTDPDNQSAEFGVIIRSDLKGKGLGYVLMNKLIRYYKSRGTQEIIGEALSQNTGVQNLVRNLGFEISNIPDSGTVRLLLNLRPESTPEKTSASSLWPWSSAG
ncbi:MAG: bifunctional acetate--CoA ligase family protein/GNAT family N-acetyltransferase [Burkholderiales bacterium]|nr:bifunctional acetate--CoA ligase family protein/GNAT family N-acetyltransferase [Burkholderiales bacterium]